MPAAVANHPPNCRVAGSPAQRARFHQPPGIGAALCETIGLELCVIGIPRGYIGLVGRMAEFMPPTRHSECSERWRIPVRLDSFRDGPESPKRIVDVHVGLTILY